MILVSTEADIAFDYPMNVPMPTGPPIQAPLNDENPLTVCSRNKALTDFAFKYFSKRNNNTDENSNVSVLRKDTFPFISLFERRRYSNVSTSGKLAWKIGFMSIR